MDGIQSKTRAVYKPSWGPSRLWMLFSRFFTQKLSDITQMSPFSLHFFSNFLGEMPMTLLTKENTMSEFNPIFLTDKNTFCTHIYNACVTQGKTPTASRRDFVDDCAARYPTTIAEDIVVKGTQFRWEFNSDYLTAPKYGVSPSRNFTVSRLHGAPSGAPATGQDVLQKVAQQQTDKCDEFGGGPGLSAQGVSVPETSHNKGHLLSPEATAFEDVGFWGGLLIGGGFLVSEIIGFFFGPKIPAGAYGGMFGTNPHDQFGRNANIL